MNKIKKYFLLLFLFSSIISMEHNLLILPTESLSHIVSYCDLYSVNNLLQSCKTIHNAFTTYSGTITEGTCQKIFFGIDRVLHDNPKICASLSNTVHLKGLMNYAQKYYCPHTNKNKTLTIFNILLKNATYEQKEQHISLCKKFDIPVNYLESKEIIRVYQGKIPIFKDIKNTKNLSTAIDIHLINRTKSVMSLEDLFFIAVNNNIISSVKKILDTQKISVNVQNKEKQTALIIAVNKEYLELVTLLLTYNNIELNTLNNYKHSALSIATCNNTTEILTLLLNHPKIDLNTEQVHLALINTARRGYLEMIKLLLQHPQINTHQWVNKAFIKAMGSQKATSIVQYLLNHPNIDLATYGAQGLYNAIHESYINNICANNINILFNDPHIHHININVIQEKGDSCLFYAFKCIIKENIKYGENYKQLINIIKLLLNHKNIDVNIIYYSKTYRLGWDCDIEDGWTALYYVAHNGNDTLTELLLNHPDIDPNIICDTDKQKTALHVAIHNKDKTIIKLLLNHPKTDPCIIDKNGKTAIDYLIAKDNEYEDILLLIREKFPHISFNINKQSEKTTKQLENAKITVESQSENIEKKIEKLRFSKNFYKNLAFGTIFILSFLEGWLFLDYYNF